MAAVADRGTFYGWRVVGAAFVLAVFGWGIGFFGPPVFLSTLQATRGWPLSVVSTAVTIHFLVGALVGAQPAGALSPLRSAGRHQGRLAGARRRHLRLVAW